MTREPPPSRLGIGIASHCILDNPGEKGASAEIEPLDESREKYASGDSWRGDAKIAFKAP